MSVLFWRRASIKLYKPDADSVALVIDGYRKSWPMKSENNGHWHTRLHLPLRDLNGRAYHFEVKYNGSTSTIADPLAHRTARINDILVSYFCDLSYRWREKHYRTPKFKDIVIYEAHLPALSRHASTEVTAEKHRGTYVGAKSPAILRHFRKLGVAVEFLPLHASDALLGADWGYFSTSFNALREGYALNSHETNHEVMGLIDAMHCQGIPVLLDVVFNHGGELLVKAWGKNIVYRKFENGDFCEGSGCGPTINTEHPVVRETIINTLEHLVRRYRFDGFRFDLGALHDKFTMREIDRRLPSRIYLIAEPWALGGTLWGKGDLHGDLASTRWAVWNDDFREPAKTFLMGKGDQHNRGRLMAALKGCNVRDGGWSIRPQQCINYLSSHDGKTLTDFTGGDKKRVFLGIMLALVSQGIPMIAEGSEMMYSKNGEANSYNRPELNQLDWHLAQQHHDLVDAVAGLISLRKSLPHFSYTGQLTEFGNDAKNWDVDWIYPTGFPHDDNLNAIGLVLRPPGRKYPWPRGRNTLVILLNGSENSADFSLPKGKWKVLVDGNSLDVNAHGIIGVKAASGSYFSHPGTGVMLVLI